MMFVTRAAFYALIYAVLTDAGDPWNWGVGASFGCLLAVAATVRRRQPERQRPASPLRLAWLVVGMVTITAVGAVRVLAFMLARRSAEPPELVSCRGLAQTERGLAVLALSQTVSCGIVAAEENAETGGLALHVLDPAGRTRACADVARHYDRYQRKSIP